MNTLKEIQEKFQQSILNQDDSILNEIKDTSKEKSSVLLNVYQHAYGARLIEFLENDYPITASYIGGENFHKLSEDYYQKHPSDDPNARWFGRHFPEFLANHPDYQNNPECAELANLEYALAIAFDAQDVKPLTLAALTNLSPENWPALTFKRHPSISTITNKTNASSIWTAINDERTPEPASKLDTPTKIICWRGDNMARFRPMNYDEAMIWQEAINGANFSHLCEMLGTYWPEEEAPLKAAGYLQAWLSSEFLIEN